ncbi:MAG: metallophosphoesterase family protein [Alphaproteobacteria bacterium]|nr:metallophosphoesterase family protein [Alphaproteobacteria bacterium]
MSLAVIGDVHANSKRLERVLRRVDEVGVDAILLVGDLGSHALSLRRLRTSVTDAVYLRSVRQVLEACAELGVPVRYVPGNHDLPDLDLPGNLDGRVETLGGLRVAGLGGAGPAKFGFCYEWDEDEARARTLPDCDVLLCHCPPADTPLDVLARDGRHVGSQAIRERALAHRGVLVCGHIHESAGLTQLGDCLCVNVGALGRPFGRACVGFIESLDAARVEELEAGTVQRLERVAPGL